MALGQLLEPKILDLKYIYIYIYIYIYEWDEDEDKLTSLIPTFLEISWYKTFIGLI